MAVGLPGGHGDPGGCHAALAARTAAQAGRLVRLTGSAPGRPCPSYGARLREGYQQIARSPFLRWMALSTFCMTVLMTLLNYGASAIFQEELKTTVAISDFLGVLSGVANLVVLPFQLFVLSRLIARLGLGNASMIFPLATLAAAGSLAIAPGLGTAAFAYLDRTALRTAFRIPTDNLLYNAVPQRVKARTRAFVGGLVVPIGAILGGLLLLTPLMRTSWFLPAAMLVLAVAFALAALMVRRHYGQALVDLLEQEDYSSLALQAPSPQEPSALAAADPATLARLAQKLTESTKPRAHDLYGPVDHCGRRRGRSADRGTGCARAATWTTAGWPRRWSMCSLQPTCGGAGRASSTPRCWPTATGRCAWRPSAAWSRSTGRAMAATWRPPRACWPIRRSRSGSRSACSRGGGRSRPAYRRDQRTACAPECSRSAHPGTGSRRRRAGPAPSDFFWSWCVADG